MAVKMSKRDTTLLSCVGAVLVLGGGYMFVLKPARADLGTAKASLEEATSSLEQDQNTLLGLQKRKTNGTQVSALTLRTLKAIPVGPQTAGSLTQIQRMATRADVKITTITSSARVRFGNIEAETFALDAQGTFFDVSDFLYRMQRQVEVARNGRPLVRGRLLATNKVEITPIAEASDGTAKPKKLSASSHVSAKLDVIAFNLSYGATAGSASGSTTPAAATTGTQEEGA